MALARLPYSTRPSVNFEEMPTRPAFQAILLAGLLGANAALAAPPAGAPAPGPPPGSPHKQACSHGQNSAISEIGCELSNSLGAVPARALVVAAPLASETKLENAALLGRRITRVVAGALGRQVRAHDEPAGLARARTLASEAGTLVYLQPHIARGQLQVTADEYPVPHNFWDRVRDPEPSPVRHAFASRRIDAEIRSFLPPVRLVVGHIDKASSPERNPVALACAELPGQTGLELVVAGRHGIHLGRIRSGRMISRASVAWTALSPVAPFPLRQPLGAIAIDHGHIDVGISDRAQEVRLGPELEPIARVPRRIPWAPGGCVRFSGVSLATNIGPCMEGDGGVTLPGFDSPADAVAGALIVGRDGKPHRFRAERVFNHSVALLRDDRGRTARVDGAGAQLALGDVDGDGQPELLSGADTLDPLADALIVHTWLDDGRVVERLRLAVPDGVRALAVCPPEDEGRAPVAIATGDSLWILH